MNLRLKLSLTPIILVLFFAIVTPVLAQDQGGGLSTAPYKIGERLTYNVSFSNFPSAAHVEIEVVSRGVYMGRDAIQLRAHVETQGVINVALFALNNDYITYIDPETGLPFHSQETIREATSSTDSSQDFNQSSGTDAIPPRQQGSAGTYDILSAVYRARALPLSQGSSYSFSVRGETGTYSAEMKVTDSQVVRTNVGSFTTLVAKVNVSDSMVKNLKVYFSDDDRHIPVLLTARIRNGDLRAELAASEVVKSVQVATPTPVPTPSIAATPRPTPRPNPSPTPVLVTEEWPFKIGEQLNYQVFIGTSTTPVATATFQLRGRSRFHDRDGLMLTVHAQTTGAAARLFSANDQINSYVDPKSLLPYRSEFSLVEGNRRLNQILTFNQDYGNITSNTGLKIDVPVGTYDYVAFFYAMRLFNLNPPKRNAISILVENKPKTLFVSSTKREAIQLGDQKIPAIALALTTDDPQSDKYALRMWVSDDKRRLPLRITCATELGPLRADLVILPTNNQ
ncbi:MAG: hypothetical protein C5B55_04315 [Blastocatellia bacterium]|nr:MAG: hypothetical protein C5B55_04315 [Blastocatellia bacterium]